MSEITSITFGCCFPPDLLEELDSIEEVAKRGRSRFIQKSVRAQLKKEKNLKVLDLVSELDPREIEILKEIIKKGSI